MRKILLCSLIFIVPAIAVAQGRDSGRAQGWDFSLAGIYQQSDVAGGQGGSSLNVDDAWGIGLNIGYNFNNRLNVSADIEYLRPDYKAVLVDENDPTNTITVDHTMTEFNGRFKGTFYFTDGPFVPYIEAGFGWTDVDSNVADGPLLPDAGGTHGGDIFALIITARSAKRILLTAEASACATR